MLSDGSAEGAGDVDGGAAEMSPRARGYELRFAEFDLLALYAAFEASAARTARQAAQARTEQRVREAAEEAEADDEATVVAAGVEQGGRHGVG